MCSEFSWVCMRQLFPLCGWTDRQSVRRYALVNLNINWLPTLSSHNIDWHDVANPHWRQGIQISQWSRPCQGMVASLDQVGWNGRREWNINWLAGNRQHQGSTRSRCTETWRLQVTLLLEWQQRLANSRHDLTSTVLIDTALAIAIDWLLSSVRHGGRAYRRQIEIEFTARGDKVNSN